MAVALNAATAPSIVHFASSGARWSRPATYCAPAAMNSSPLASPSTLDIQTLIAACIKALSIVGATEL